MNEKPPYSRSDFIVGFMRDGMTPEMRIMAAIFKVMGVQSFNEHSSFRIVKTPRRLRSRSYAGKLFDAMWADAPVKKGNEEMKKTTTKTTAKAVAKATSKKTTVKAVKAPAKKVAKAPAKKVVAAKKVVKPAKPVANKTVCKCACKCKPAVKKAPAKKTCKK